MPAPHGFADGAAATGMRERRPRQAPLDMEGVIRAAVERMKAQGDAEAERLREAIRKAVAVLEGAVE